VVTFEVGREQVLQDHDSDIGLARAGLQVDDVAEAHLVVCPVLLDSIVDRKLVRERLKL